jgi:hypothetical protein
MFKFDAIVCQCLRSVYVDVSLDIVTLLVIIEGFPLISLLFLLSWVLVLIFLFLFSLSVLDDNPWREASKPVYVLTQKENQLCTMKTRRNIRCDSLFSCSFFSSNIWNFSNPDFTFYVTAKLKESLAYCFLKEATGELQLEIRLNKLREGQNFQCRLKILERECWYVFYSDTRTCTKLWLNFGYLLCHPNIL